MGWEISYLGDLTVALLRYHQQLAAIIRHIHTNHAIVRAQAHPPHPTRHTAHRAHISLAHAYCLASRGRDNDVIITTTLADPAQLIAVVQVNRNQAVIADIGVILKRCLFDRPLHRRHKQVAIISGVLLALDHRCDFLLWLQL